jgi:hypothetical protein
MKASQIRAKRLATGPKEVRIILGGQASYFKGLNAVAEDEEKPNVKSFSSGVLWHKDAPKQVMQVVEKAIEDAIKIGIETKWNGHKPSDLKQPLRDGDDKYHEDKDKNANYKGMRHLTARKYESQGKPVLVANGQRVVESGVIESGDWCAFDLTFYPFANKSKGVAVVLNGCTLIEEGERFGGGPSEDSVISELGDLYDDILTSEFGGEEEDDIDADDLLA